MLLFFPKVGDLHSIGRTRRGGLFTGISQLYSDLGGQLKQGSGVTSKGVPQTLGYYPFIRSLLFSVFLGHREGPILSLLNSTQPPADDIKESKRPSSRWRAQRALDAVQHAGTEIEIGTGTRRSHQGIGIGTRPATQRTEIGGKRAVMLTRTVDNADLLLHGARHTMMEMVQTNISKRTRRTETEIVTVARVRRIIRKSGGLVVTDEHAARADPPLARAHDLDPDNALEHATQSGAQVETGP